ncbi:Low molecular weight protein tyrosine phosphatase [hydrothermal vent metagenome]|uniref:protein-tyrosine-phosphatase n=1 Tax=hydrothermal vent metagenome TaxID=652676 RepID=A0A3B0ZWB9_9ZZZZ
MVKVLFVCMGNICRSPTAHGVFEHLVQQASLAKRIEIDSAGTHAYHVGEPPDKRSQASALNRGFDLSSQRARRVQKADFDYYDYVIAMDNDNLSNLLEICPRALSNKVSLFLSYADNVDEDEVPDPYYGGSKGFERVLDMVESAADGLLGEIKEKYLK